jgi:hypothetical protein
MTAAMMMVGRIRIGDGRDLADRSTVADHARSVPRKNAPNQGLSLLFTLSSRPRGDELRRRVDLD